jgi:hypothetical protein
MGSEKSIFADAYLTNQEREWPRKVCAEELRLSVHVPRGMSTPPLHRNKRRLCCLIVSL